MILTVVLLEVVAVNPFYRWRRSAALRRDPGEPSEGSGERSPHEAELGPHPQAAAAPPSRHPPPRAATPPRERPGPFTA
ncbi:unnamed protein product [Rangifer tarandus platyrhynchus]|uniref:Uncharacterized protein n=1 Tax=Rangifer tarandus platyrhynchus TaxID=3082113 RepID=A0AC59Z8N5_RANTA